MLVDASRINCCRARSSRAVDRKRGALIMAVGGSRTLPSLSGLHTRPVSNGRSRISNECAVKYRCSLT